MVASASAYRWSSHNGNMGYVANQLLTPHAEYLALALDATARHTAYRDLFATADEPTFLAAVRDATNGGFALVGEHLKSALPEAAQRRLERRPPGPPPRLEHYQDDISAELGLRPRIS